MQVPQHQLSACLLVIGLLKVHVGGKFFDNFNGHVMFVKPNFRNEEVDCTEFTLDAPTHTFCSKQICMLYKASLMKLLDLKIWELKVILC